jgi:hypothetical protein
MGASKTNTKKPKKKCPRRKKGPAKLGFKVAIELPTGGTTRKADVTITDKDDAVVTTDRADLADGRERARLAKKFTTQFQKGTPEQWEAALQQAFLKAVEERKAAEQHAQQNPPAANSPCSPGSLYRIEDGRICMARHTTNGDEINISLCNFSALVTENVRVDDGSGDVEQYFVLSGALDNGTTLPATTIRADDFVAMNWPVACWGLRAIVTPGLGCRDHLRAAIQWLSDKAVDRTVYKHTGWRQIGGVWHYLHAKGAITAHGVNPDISVDLTGPLARFALPVPPIGDDLRTAVRACLSLCSSVPRLMAPILGQVYRAVLGPVDWSLHVVGHTGLGKSEAAALGQQHFGPEMHRLNLPANWQSTGNALVELAFLAKDAVLVIDDFKPAGARFGIDQMHQLAERVLRAQGNHSGRARCRQDGSLRSPRPPRATILSTGEDAPRGESLQARTFTIHVTKDDIDVRALTPLQEDAAQGLYAAAMSGYLRWLAARLDQIRSTLDAERALLRQKAMTTRGHARTAGIVADLALGWMYFLEFAVEACVLDAAEGDEVYRDAWATLLQVAAKQEEAIADQEPAGRFLKLLTSVLASGRGHVTNRDGLEPADALMWGWREELGSSEDFKPFRKAQGKQVGWVDGDDLFLDPEISYAEVQRLGDDQGERLALSKAQLGRHLKAGGWLRSIEAEKTTTRRTLQGREHAVWHLAAGSLIPAKTGGTGGTGVEAAKNGGEHTNSAPFSQNGTCKPAAETRSFAAGPTCDPPVPPVSGRDEVVL